jgi:DNA helicase TIP49 (TBP-interacting protein)
MEKKEKPLDKMTAKELREIALEIPEIEGVHAMKKEALLEAIRKSRGVEKKEEKAEVKEEKTEAEAKEAKEKEAKEKKKEEKKEVKKKAGAGVAELKKRIREFKVLKAEAVEKGDARAARIYKRRINRLKKRTRKAA